MAMNTPTRRRLIGAIAVAPIAVAPAAAALTPSNTDRELLTAFRARQQALAAIELRGTFFDCEEHSPAITDIYDQAELLIVRTPATTPAGILAKLWVALAAAGGQITTERRRHHHAVFRRADLTALAALNFSDFEYDERIIAEAVADLTKIVEG